MPYGRFTDMDERLAPSSDSETELHLRQLVGALRQGNVSVSQPALEQLSHSLKAVPHSPAEEPDQESVMAGSCPGSEYWLP
jgi:hypothetical protein